MNENDSRGVMRKLSVDEATRKEENVKDAFARGVTYYTFHIGLNYLVIGWITTSNTQFSFWPKVLLVGVFVTHNVAAMVSYGVIYRYFQETAATPGVLLPPYRWPILMQLATLAKMALVWVAIFFIF